MSAPHAITAPTSDAVMRVHLHPRELRRRRRQFAKSRVRRELLAEIDAGLHPCAECGVGLPAYLTVDHVIPLLHGGSSDRSNLQVLCRPCNSSKGTTV